MNNQRETGLNFVSKRGFNLTKTNNNQLSNIMTAEQHENLRMRKELEHLEKQVNDIAQRCNVLSDWDREVREAIHISALESAYNLGYEHGRKCESCESRKEFTLADHLRLMRGE